MHYQLQQQEESMTEGGNAKKIIQTLKKIQFISQFFILSRVSESSDYVPQFLTIIEAFKFYFKSIALVESDGIYLQSVAKPLKPFLQISSLRGPSKTIGEEVEREKKILQLIKDKPYESADFHPGMYESLAGVKRMQTVTACDLPKQLEKSPLTFMNIVGEVLSILRPLISILFIRIYGIESYKSYFPSLLIDLAIIFVFQKGMKVGSSAQKEEIGERRKQMAKRYIFRKPFFNFLLQYVFIPLLGKLMKPQRILSKLIISVLRMQSSISLTL